MQPKYPLLIDRIQSTFIDFIFIIILMAVFSVLIDKYENVPDWVRIVLFAGLFIIYEPLCMVFGSTVGNYMKGIRVRKHADPEQRINILQAFIRYPVKALLGWISFLTISNNPQRRAIHDLVSGSVMIKLEPAAN